LTVTALVKLGLHSVITTSHDVVHFHFLSYFIDMQHAPRNSNSNLNPSQRGNYIRLSKLIQITCRCSHHARVCPAQHVLWQIDGSL